MMPAMNPTQRAVQHLGSQALLAEKLGIKQPTVSEWARGDRPIPIERCVDIERATDGAVTRRELRPEDWHRIWPELITPDHPAPSRAAIAREDRHATV